MPANTANLVHNQNDWNLPTHKHKSHWAEKLYQTSQILPPPLHPVFCCGWFTNAIFILCGQTVKLKPISSLGSVHGGNKLLVPFVISVIICVLRYLRRTCSPVGKKFSIAYSPHHVQRFRVCFFTGALFCQFCNQKESLSELIQFRFFNLMKFSAPIRKSWKIESIKYNLFRFESRF